MFPRGCGGTGVENWQLLTPVRSRPGGVVGLNRLIRREFRRGDATIARKSWKLPPPVGADEILFADKVICLANRDRKAWDVRNRDSVKVRVANGEIGMVVGSTGKQGGKPSGIKVEFSTQPGFQFTYWVDELNAETDRGESLELAYAVTIHKAQGSQFEKTLIVVPNPCAMLSPELLYTALTRQRDRTILFFQGSPADLRRFADPAQSETARRLTRLFRPPNPFETPEGAVADASHAHRTANGEMVRSKSEVIIANTLRTVGLDYDYETPLVMSDGTSRSPDFTIRRPSRRPVFWEHLGMLDRAGYRADWNAKLAWYARHGITPLDDGGGTNGVLVCSTEKVAGPGIDAEKIEELARRVAHLM